MTTRNLTRQPAYLAPVNTNNPITRGLVDVWSGSNPYAHLASSALRILTATGTPLRVGSSVGVGMQFDGSANYLSRTGSSITSTAEASLLVIAAPSFPAQATKSVFGYGNSATANTLLFIGQGSTSNQLSWFARSDAGTAQNLQVSAPAAWTNGAPCVLVGTRSESRNFHRIYCNGASLSPTTATTLGTSTFDRTTVGGLVRNSAGLFWGGTVYLALSWNRALEEAEVIRLSAMLSSPWQVLKAPSRRVITAPRSGSEASGAGAASGTSTASGVGAATASSVGGASGSSTASATGASTASATGSAAGASAANGVSSSVASAVGSASGSSEATAIGRAVTAGTEIFGSGAGWRSLYRSKSDEQIRKEREEMGIIPKPKPPEEIKRLPKKAQQVVRRVAQSHAEDTEIAQQKAAAELKRELEEKNLEYRKSYERALEKQRDYLIAIEIYQALIERRKADEEEAIRQFIEDDELAVEMLLLM